LKLRKSGTVSVVKDAVSAGKTRRRTCISLWVLFFSCSMSLTDRNVSCHRLNPLPTMSKYTCCFAARLIKNRAVLGIFFVVWFFSHTYTICNGKKFTHKII